MKTLRKRISILPILFLITLFGHSGAAYAADSISVEAGEGNETRLIRLAMQWNWNKKWLESANMHLTGYWDLSVASWKGSRFQDQKDESQNISAIGLIPVFRFQAISGHGLYVEAGTGPHLLSELYDNNKKQLSTRFQFGSLIGVGYAFQNNWEMGIRYQHYSNASIKKPNDGVNFLIARLNYRF